MAVFDANGHSNSADALAEQAQSDDRRVVGNFSPILWIARPPMRFFFPGPLTLRVRSPLSAGIWIVAAFRRAQAGHENRRVKQPLAEPLTVTLDPVEARD
jgi:hypothetical protein